MTANYEDLKKELVETVQAVERGGLSLNDQLAKVERGKALMAEMEAYLGTFETKAQEVTA